MSSQLVSIIIRTRNEERWITHCLNAVFKQVHKDFEVIVVDNQSTDRTLEKVRQYPIRKMVSCTDYRPGKALNLGIRESAGSYIVCLSGHCIPTNEHWLGNLLRNFRDAGVAGVYGRQEPMSFTPDADKRDLAVVFGLDRKVQVKDSFFHNANSMIRSDLWRAVPFDEHATNIEDRIWAKEMLKRGHQLVYEPAASVFHHHGIHQNGDEERCTNVVKILESLHDDLGSKSIEAEQLNTVALIPVRGELQMAAEKPLLAYTLERALEAKYIKRVVVSTDNPEVARWAEAHGAQAPFIREASLSQSHVDIAKVLQYSLLKLEELGVYPDLVMSLEVTFPFRRPSLLDDMIAQLTQGGLDSVIAAKKENKAIWTSKDKEMIQLVEGLTPRQYKDPTFVELRGLGCVTHPEFLRLGSLLGERIGIYDVDHPSSHLEVRNEEDIRTALPLLKEWMSVSRV